MCCEASVGLEVGGVEGIPSEHAACCLHVRLRWYHMRQVLGRQENLSIAEWRTTLHEFQRMNTLQSGSLYMERDSQRKKS